MPCPPGWGGWRLAVDAQGQPITRLVDGIPVLERGPALVETSSNAANTAGQARKSRLTEILWGQALFAGSGARLKNTLLFITFLRYFKAF